MPRRRGDTDWVDFRRLALFLQVAEAGSFSRAAAVLAISQSVLSRYIRGLELGAGVRVFYRDGRGVQLTEAGKRLQAHARNILAEVAAARSDITEVQQGISGNVAVGVQPAVGRLLTVPIASRVLRELPEVRVHVMEGLSGHILEWLLAGRIDLALHYDQPNLNRGNSEPVLAQDLLLVGPPDAGLRLQRPVPATRLGEVPLILPGRQHGLRLTLDALAARKGFALSVPIEIDSAASITGLVAQGLGYTVLPLNSIIDAFRARQVSASWIAKPRVTRTLLMTLAAHRPLTTTVRRLMQIVRQEARRVSSETLLAAGSAGKRSNADQPAIPSKRSALR